jgi:NTE family protein
MTTAVVMSGGGIRGPLQVGALEALLEHGVKIDMVVGTSAGSLNAGFLAAMGAELSTIPHLKDAWRKATRDVVYPGNILTIAGRLVDGKDGLFPTDGMKKLILDNLPPGTKIFSQLKIPCYLTAVDLRSKKLFVFGDDLNADVIDGMMASSVIPVLQPPWDYQGLQLVDGGVLAEVPASVAMDHGADVIYAINVGSGEEVDPPAHGLFNIFLRTIDTFLLQSFFLDLKRADADPAVALHHVQITAFRNLEFNDFSKTEEQFKAGKETMEAYLANPNPRALAPQGAEGAEPVQVGGAREYVLPQFR